jgi:hypothetical protein
LKGSVWCHRCAARGSVAPARRGWGGGGSASRVPGVVLLGEMTKDQRERRPSRRPHRSPVRVGLTTAYSTTDQQVTTLRAKPDSLLDQGGDALRWTRRSMPVI